MSGVRRGSSSHWPSASAEPRKSGRGVPSCHEALRPDSVCQNRTFCARRIVPSARLLVTTESAIRREEPLCPVAGGSLCSLQVHVRYPPDLVAGPGSCQVVWAALEPVP
jgi:hypothetical protein